MAIKDTNYFTIQGWMINELGLKGNELIIYAIIYGFSQDGEQKFTGSLKYLADATLSSKNGVAKNLKSLCEKGFLARDEKVINGVKFVDYYTTKLDGVYNSVVQGIQQSCTGGIQQSCTHNNNKHNNKDINKDKEHGEEETTPSPVTKKSENGKVKSKYGEYKNVFLTDDEISKLDEQYGNSSELITHLDEYIEMTGKKYKSHYLAIKKWVVNAVEEKSRGKSKVTQDNSVPENKPISSLEARLQARLHERVGAESTSTSEAVSKRMAELGVKKSV